MQTNHSRKLGRPSGLFLFISFCIIFFRFLSSLLIFFLFLSFLFFLGGGVWVVFWTVTAVQRPSRRLHRRCVYFFYPLSGTEHGSQPSLTTRDRELVSVLEVRIEPGYLNPRPLTPQSVTTHSTTGWVDNTRATYIHEILYSWMELAFAL